MAWRDASIQSPGPGPWPHATPPTRLLPLPPGPAARPMGEALALFTHCSSEAGEQDRFPYLADSHNERATLAQSHNERAARIPFKPHALSPCPTQGNL